MALSKITNDGVATSGLPAGSVLQVVNSAVAPSNITTTSTSFVTTGVSISITPTSTSSKIIIMLTGGGHYVPESSQFCYVTVFRGATNIGDTTRGLETFYSLSSTPEIRSHALSVVDSPNTTSSTTYTFYMRKDGGATAYQFNGAIDRSELTVIAMEIAG
tara:strand:- start:293 stop:772 length:480 start_codon:yes stop_codon:yes gene_type:complete